jgi:acyl-CoA thioester hydrolase
MPEFVYITVVKTSHLDEAGHLGNAEYLRIAEAAARNHALEVGLDYAGFVALGVLPMVHRHSITYKRRVLQGRLELRTAITSWQGFRCTRKTSFWQNEHLMAELESEWIWVDSERFRPKPAPLEVRQVLTDLQPT